MSIHHRRGLTIHTDFAHPPIPHRNFDWSAILDNYEGGDTTGWGPTEEMAIADLLEQLEVDDEQLRYDTEMGVTS